VTVRVCVWTPPPHLAEQADQVDQPLTTQLTAHGWVLQFWVCDSAGHALPPNATLTTMARVCL